MKTNALVTRALEPPPDLRAVPDAPAEPGAIDWKDLRERLDGDEELALEILAAFASDAPGLVARLGALVFAEADLAAIARQAHQIKGAAANSSVQGMRAAAHRMELAGKAGERGDMAANQAALEKALAAFQRELAQRSAR